LVDEQSPSDMDRWVERLIDGIPDNPELLRSDIWDISMLAGCLPEEMRRQKGYETTLQHSMSSDRFRDRTVSFGQVRLAPLAPQQRARLWAVRNAAEWKSKGKDAARDEFVNAHANTIGKGEEILTMNIHTMRDLTWYRLAMAQGDGYLIVDKTAPAAEVGYEDHLRRLYCEICHERRIPFVRLNCFTKTCEIILDFDSADRGPAGEIHPLPPAANDAIDEAL